MDGFSPEVFSRKLPNGQRDIFLAGVNSSRIPLPAIATDVASQLDSRSPEIESLLKVAKTILQRSGSIKSNIIRASLCHRPVTDNRTPVIARIDSKHYSPVTSESAGRGGVYVCAGHGPWGISLGPGSGKLCADMMLGREVPAYLSKLGL